MKIFFHYLIALAAYWYYGRPARKLIVIGVTGTKGKSTTCRFVDSVLEAAGFKVALLSTVEIKVAGKEISDKPGNTMIGRGRIQKYLRQAVSEGCRYAVIETSSEGIVQFRHLGLEYDIAVFTNLGTEHQERHGGFENLKKTKGKLFASLSRGRRKIIGGKSIPKIIIANLDSEHYDYFLNFPADEKYTYAIHTEKANYRAEALSADSAGTVFKVGNDEFKLNIVGSFNIYNALAAVVIGRSQGVPADKIRAGLASVSVIPGRMEFIDLGQPFKVVVDYAHEPISLTALFSSLRPLVGEGGKLVGVIGSDGGGRDIQKRPKMGEVAGRLCDVVIVADVNPWDEDPMQIAEMLAKGARQAGKKDNDNLFIDVDRRAAIKLGMEKAGAGGVVAITAKGTESAIVVKGGKRIPWDDRAVVKEILQTKFNVV